MSEVGGLNHEQARFFRSQGYFRMPDVFDAAQVAELKEFVIDEAEKQSSRAPKFGGVALKMYGLYDRNPTIIDKVVRNPVLTASLSGILGPNIVMVKNRHNHATLNNHRGAPAEGLHRDILQPTRGLVTAAVYLEDATVDNGCTHIVPGSHDLPYVGVPQADGGGTWMSEHHEYAGLEDQAVPVPIPAGGVLLFNGLTFHGVGANMSGSSRMSMTFGFRSTDELEFTPDHSRLVVVAGEHIYRGNDR